MIGYLLLVMVTAEPTIESMAKSERGLELPCGVEEEVLDVPTSVEIRSMKKIAAKTGDSTELELQWAHLRTRKALRVILVKKEMTCDEFHQAYRAVKSRAAEKASRIYGASRKTISFELVSP